MGALHEGHLSLVRQAKSQCDLCVTTIFVNPTQFAANEDLSKYPRPLDRDLEMLTASGVDAVFLPTDALMYPQGFSTYVTPPAVGLTLEGQHRPEHFRGVTTVVMKLFQIIPSDAAFFGRKDFQQLRVIEHMVRDLNVPIEIVPCEIVREADGLAVSSRNRYLNDEQRSRALSLSRALNAAQNLVRDGETQSERIEAAMMSELSHCDRVDYAVVVDADTLQRSDTMSNRAVALIAARVGETRLIDNCLL